LHCQAKWADWRICIKCVREAFFFPDNGGLEIANDGGLYGKLTIDKLGQVHADTRNQTLANILEMQRVAENRYSGIPTIRQAMAAYRLPEPIFENRRGNFVITLKNGENYRLPETNPAAEKDLIAFCKTPRTRHEIAEYLGKTQYYAMQSFVNPLLATGQLKMTIPDKPKSRNQKYYS